jgi:hypothetical protein
VTRHVGVKIKMLCQDQKRVPGLVGGIFLTVGFWADRSHFVWIRAEPSLSVSRSALEISRFKPQGDTEDLCRDSPQKVGSANLNNLCDVPSEGHGPWGQAFF